MHGQGRPLREVSKLGREPACEYLGGSFLRRRNCRCKGSESGPRLSMGRRKVRRPAWLVRSEQNAKGREGRRKQGVTD